MEKDTTRRRLLQGLAASAFGSIAGCTARSLGDRSGTPTGSNSQNNSTGTESSSYSVSIAPVGKLKFEEVPTKWLASSSTWADMGIALGRNPPEGVWNRGFYYTQQYYDEIPGVSVDENEMVELGNAGSTEVFHEIGADLHVMDPISIVNRSKSFERPDIERVKKNVAPFFGNYIDSYDHSWHDYRYYTLYEAFGKLAEVFQQQHRYEAFAKLHEEVQQTIEANLPSKGERPSVAIMLPVGDKPEKFWPHTIDKGTNSKQWRDLKVRDALAQAGIQDYYATGGSTQIDYETLLEIDPEIIMMRTYEDYSAKKFQNTVVEFMKNHPVGSKLQAVNNGQVFRGGPFYQGPIVNLVLTERAANQLYPDAFSGVQLYDPQRVSDIVHGRF